MLAAEKGHAAAQYEVGYACFWGKGVEINVKEAFKWHTLAKNNGMSMQRDD